MMPGIGFTEMILLVVVAIVVIGPKDLPLMMRKFGRFTGKMRAMAYEFQQGIDELGRQAELEELRKEVADLKKHTGLEELHKDLTDTNSALIEDHSREMWDASAPVPSEASPVDNSEMPALPAPTEGALAEGEGSANAVAASLPDHTAEAHILGEPDTSVTDTSVNGGLAPADGEPVAAPAAPAKYDVSAL
jgi:sec-independent protein translocase protein TatB